MQTRAPASLRTYVAILGAVFFAIVIQTVATTHVEPKDYLYLAILGGMFFAAEFADIYFYDASGARWGLSASEAVLAPMIVALPVALVVLGVALAIVLERVLRRLEPMKVLFNTASFGCGAAAAAGFWSWTNDGSGRFTIRNAALLFLSVCLFAILTHLFTSVVIALSERRSVVEVSLAVASTTVVSLVGAIMVGLFFAAAIYAGTWTIVLFPPAMAGLFLANRALVGQRRERERVESLHAATRALVAGGDLGPALLGFLEQVRNVASAEEARAVVLLSGTPLWSGVREHDTLADLAPLEDKAMLSLVGQLPESGAALIIRQDDSSPLAQAFGGKGFVAVPVRESDETVGCLIVSQRVGAGDFDEGEGRLLEALAAELAVSLGAYRLFAEVAEERERFGRIFNSSKEGICLLDIDGVVRAWNPALETITGYSESELMGRVWSDVVFVRDRNADRVSGDELTGVEPDEELELVTKSGPSRWVSVMSGPVHDTDGNGWVVLVRDVSAEHAVEAAKSDFLSTVSHELRTPLTTIKGSLQVLGRGRESIPENLHDQMIEVTTRGAERLERLVMNLLLVSQIESRTMAVFNEELALDALVKEKIASILPNHPRTEVVLPEKPLVVRADQEPTGLAVEHLLDNARKFGGPDGEIRVEVFTEGGYGCLSVADDGPGIAPDDQDRIFDRFVRLGDVLTRETQGAGVGLFIAKRTIEAMGGRIWVESALGHGATFHVAIPLAHPVAVPDAARA